MNDKEGDLCCNAAFYWGGQIPLCAGAFVSFMGTEMDEFSSSPCNSMKTGVFLVGVTLCPPDNDAKASLIADYGDCLFQLAEHLSACLVGCLCEERDTVISGVRSDPEGMFFEVRKRITNPVA